MTTYTVNASILLTDLPIAQRPAAVADAGFAAVEFWWPFPVAVPADAEVDAFVSAVRDAGVQLSGLNFFAGDMAGGDRGLVSWAGRESEFADNVDVVVGIGNRLGCRAFNALYGLRADGVAHRGRPTSWAWRTCALAADKIAEIGGTVLLEPVSGAPAYPLKTAADVLSVIEKVGADNLELLADFYHLAVNGDDVAAVIANHAADFGHIQIADDPGRGQPGSGKLPLERVARRRPGRRVRRLHRPGVQGLLDRPVRLAPSRSALLTSHTVHPSTQLNDTRSPNLRRTS